MFIETRFDLNFYSWTFVHNYVDHFTEVPFRNTNFTLKVIAAYEEHNQMQIDITWTQQTDETSVSDELKRKLVEKAVDFLNYIIYHARTFDLQTSNMVLVSPRTLRTISLKVRDKEKLILFERVPLFNEPPQHFKEYFEYLNEPGAFDVFSELIRQEEIALLEINLLVDAFHAIYESRYSEAVINCLTAVETHISPLLREWLKDKFVNKNDKRAESTLLEIPYATKYELLFGSICADLLGKRTGLLEQLKGINQLRNEIIHKGKRATKAEANHCLNTVSKLLMILFFKLEPDQLE